MVVKWVIPRKSGGILTDYCLEIQDTEWNTESHWQKLFGEASFSIRGLTDGKQQIIYTLYDKLSASAFLSDTNLSRPSSGVTYKRVVQIGNWIYLLLLKPQQITIT
jgi:hypothetical protein